MSEYENILKLVKKYWFVVALVLIVLVALWYRMGVINSYIIPTYGNTMYHVGMERETILTQHYPNYELSYGGGFPNFYVPAYRLLISSMSVATGIDPMVMSGLMTITLALFILLAMFIVAYRLSDNLYVSLFAAFFFIMSPEITIFTMRSLPELLGLFMVPFTLYFVIRKNWIMAVIGAAITALTHQMTLATLVAVLGLYTVFLFIQAGRAYMKKEKTGEKLKEALLCLAPILSACITYAIWQMYSLGTLSLMSTAQMVNHEGNTVDLPLLLRTGVFVLPFFVIGLVFIVSTFWDSLKGNKMTEAKGVYGYSITADSVLLVVAWIIATLILTFNDRINPLIKFINIYIGSVVTIPTISIFPLFMDRFFTFFVQIAIIVAGFGMYALLRAIDLDALKVKP
jgi:hypothetical protein